MKPERPRQMRKNSGPTKRIQYDTATKKGGKERTQMKHRSVQRQVCRLALTVYSVFKHLCPNADVMISDSHISSRMQAKDPSGGNRRGQGDNQEEANAVLLSFESRP